MGWARPESTGFSIETLLKIKANLARVSHRRNHPRRRVEVANEGNFVIDRINWSIESNT